MQTKKNKTRHLHVVAEKKQVSLKRERIKKQDYIDTTYIAAAYRHLKKEGYIMPALPLFITQVCSMNFKNKGASLKTISDGFEIKVPLRSVIKSLKLSLKL